VNTLKKERSKRNENDFEKLSKVSLDTNNNSVSLDSNRSNASNSSTEEPGIRKIEDVLFKTVAKGGMFIN